MADRLTSGGENARAREVGMPTFRERLQRHEEAVRKQAFEEGRERPRRSREELDRIAETTARRHDQRNER